MMGIALRQSPKRRTLRSLVSDCSALALTEFAMALPILCTLCVAGVETANYVTTNMRLSQIALSVADNSGRIRDTIDETDVDSIMIGARLTGQSFDFGTNGRVILSMIEPNGQTGSNAGQQITWQRCFGVKNVASSYGVEGAGATNATYAAGFGPTGNKIAATTGNGVMFAEVVYDYQAVFPVANSMIVGLRGKTLRFTAAFPVRERDDNAIKNGFNLASGDKRLCSRFSDT